MESRQVEAHYNARPKETVQTRRNSAIYHLRQFNNWLKFALIHLHTRPGASVLDLCCGKGGDLIKWTRARCSHYVGCDVARVSVEEAANRWNKMRDPPFRPVLLVGDCFGVRLIKHIPQSRTFDIVSCQFAIHYAFESEQRVRNLLHNVSDRLTPGGYFVGTTVDANVLIRKIRSVEGLEISSSVYRVRFDEQFANKRFPRGNPYGIRYHFTLDQSVEDCPEYLVHFPSFVELAKEFDLELMLLCNFHDFFIEFASDDYPDFRKALFHMNVLDESGTMPPDEWDAIYLYTAFAFRKRGDPQQRAPLSADRQSWSKVNPDEIIEMTSDSNGS